MIENLHGFVAFCAADTALHGGLLAGLLAAGAAGSVMHCGPMCGVFVLGQMSNRMARLPARQLCEWRRVERGLLLPYHCGRLTTYSGLGALAAASASVLGRAPWFGALSAVLLMVAALLFLAHVLYRLLGFRLDFAAAGRFKLPIAMVADRIPRGTPLGEYLLGVTLGFLPCGLLYAALTAAAGTGSAGMGALAMLAFGIGTTPVLMVIGVTGQAAARRWNRTVRLASPVLMALNAVLLLILAWQRLA